MSLTPELTTVVFDIGGVLLDWDPRHGLVTAGLLAADLTSAGLPPAGLQPADAAGEAR